MIRSPVIHADSSEARKATNGAMSSGCHNRPNGVAAAIALMAEFELEGGKLLAAADAKISVGAGARFVTYLQRYRAAPTPVHGCSGGRIWDLFSTPEGTN